MSAANRSPRDRAAQVLATTSRAWGLRARAVRGIRAFLFAV
jgi:hypothetical protein